MAAARRMTVTAHRCKGGKCPEIPLPDKPIIEKTVRLWSKPDSWAKTKMVPVEGESFRIESTWNLHLDLDKPTPIFEKIEINGRLTLPEGKDHNLRARIIYIRGGELRIGTKEAPFVKNKAQISLMGVKDLPGLAIADVGTEAGNKIIMNLGTLTMYGKKRSFKMTRLAKVAKKGDTTITIDKTIATIDLVKGDRIALAATSYA